MEGPLVQEQHHRILVLNPASDATKIGVFDNDILIMEKTLHHSSGEFDEFASLAGQSAVRKQAILEALDEEGMNVSNLAAVCGRGGLLRPIEGGTYLVNEAMLEDLKKGILGQHASNLGGIVAYEIANGLNIPSFIVDPVVVDELSPLARISGFDGIERKSIFHALNQKAVARRYAKERGRSYEDVRLIVAHLGRGITVGVHQGGTVVDVNHGLLGDGPVSWESVGTWCYGDLVDLGSSGRYSGGGLLLTLVGQSEVAVDLGKSDRARTERRINIGNIATGSFYTPMA